MHKQLCLIFLAVACRTNDPTTDEDAIIGGRLDRSHRSVGQVGRFEDEDVFFHCTGTLIGPRTVLTAAHCLFDGDRRLFAPQLAFQLGDTTFRIARSSIAAYDPTRSEEWEDAALLRLQERSEVAPLPVSLDAPLQGSEAHVIGFGVTRASSPEEASGGGRRRRARITLDSVTEHEIFYSSSEAGACYGDSGGPIVQNDAVVGITSRGTQLDCRGVDIAQRADVLNAWIGRTSRGDACLGWCEE
jgi:secreted trypsin-like serine protease